MMERYLRNTLRGVLAGCALLALAAMLTGMARAESIKLKPGPVKGVAVHLDNARDYAFCEFNVGFGTTPNMTFEIYNTSATTGPGAMCPPDTFGTMDPKTLAADLGAGFVLLNPNPPTARKHWVMDELFMYVAGETADFSGVKATWMASIAERDLMSGSATPYTPVTNDQLSKWIFRKGGTVFLIRTPERKAYVMQAYTTEADKGLTYDGLAQLGSKLKSLSAGWKFEVKKLTEDLVFDTTKATPEGRKHLIKDEFKNVYLGCGFDNACNYVP